MSMRIWVQIASPPKSHPCATWAANRMKLHPALHNCTIIISIFSEDTKKIDPESEIVSSWAYSRFKVWLGKGHGISLSDLYDESGMHSESGGRQDSTVEPSQSQNWVQFVQNQLWSWQYSGGDEKTTSLKTLGLVDLLRASSFATHKSSSMAFANKGISLTNRQGQRSYHSNLQNRHIMQNMYQELALRRPEKRGEQQSIPCPTCSWPYSHACYLLRVHVTHHRLSHSYHTFTLSSQV